MRDELVDAPDPADDDALARADEEQHVFADVVIHDVEDE